jgi:hypothetical protein
MRGKELNRNPRITPNGMKLSALLLVVPASFAVAISLSACENVATYSQPTAVRVIDGSYLAPAANFLVQNELLAANVGTGSITSYGTMTPSSSASIQMTATTGNAVLLNSSSPLLAGNQYSIFLTDVIGSSTAYVMTVLQDQQTQAPTGRAAFRFLNQAEMIGAVDIYMVPAGTAIADAVPLETNLPVGGPPVYVSFPAQSVTMIITPTGVTAPAYTSSPIQLIGGEARTVLIMDAKLTSTPPVTVTMADDAGPAN